MGPGLSLSVVIPTWNGLHLLKKYLPSVIRAAECYQRSSGADFEILVVDDGSTDATVSYLRGHPVKGVRLLSRPENKGFAITCNAGFREARYELVGLINNDVELHPEYFIFLAPHFSNPEIFAVTAKVYDPGTTIFNAGGRFASFRRGFWSVYFNYDTVPGKDAQEWTDCHRLLSFCAIGGFAAYRKSELLKLGGFLEILSPFHWEDVDLSYRGWKRGMKVGYEPRSLAWHQASSTINRHFESKIVECHSFKNRLLFHWINIHSKPMLACHLLSLSTMCILKALTLDRYFFKAFRNALRQLPEVRKLRKQEKLKSRRSDREIISILNDFYKSAPISCYFSREEILEKHPEAK
jgi:GT2 family glycosyltransferase